jgi:hypothetical protein
VLGEEELRRLLADRHLALVEGATHGRVGETGVVEVHRLEEVAILDRRFPSITNEKPRTSVTSGAFLTAPATAFAAAGFPELGDYGVPLSTE